MLTDFFMNRVFLGIAILAGIFSTMVAFGDPITVIIVLNGMFVGSMVAIVVAYHRLLIFATLGVGEYTRVRQMTIGFALAWVVIAMSAGASIYSRSHDAPIYAPTMTAAIRFLAIIAAVMQVTAPDFGLGLFHGRDRRVLWTAGTLGLISALLAIYMQDSTLLF